MDPTLHPLLPLLETDRAVHNRYSAAAAEREESLCCPVDYDRRYLAVLPQELIERDYGCGDPSRHVRPGETVLDLGCGGGKVCYIAAQVVGPQGRVIGVDVNDAMLALARRFQPEIAQRLGFDNVQIHKARIQDLALDLERFEQQLAARPIQNANDWLAAQADAARLRAQSPLIAAATVDVVVSNCVLNLVHQDDRRQLFAEMFRVLRPGGRAVISDITSDRPVPPHLQADATLWSGCISGAFHEPEFLAAFEAAGFGPLDVIERQAAPWQTVEGIEFRSVTVRAYKPWPVDSSPATERVAYRGPWQSVTDDAGRTFRRGEPTLVNSGELTRLMAEPFAPHMLVLSAKGAHPGTATAGGCCGGEC